MIPFTEDGTSMAAPAAAVNDEIWGQNIVDNFSLDTMY